MLAFLFDIFLSDKTKQVLPCLTAVSVSSLIASILSLRDFSISKVQSITFTFFVKNFLNFLNCELVWKSKGKKEM